MIDHYVYYQKEYIQGLSPKPIKRKKQVPVIIRLWNIRQRWDLLKRI